MMAGIIVPNENSLSNSSRRNLAEVAEAAAASFRRDSFNVLERRNWEAEDEEEALKWAALEKIPTWDRMHRGILRKVLDDGKEVFDEIDVRRLGFQDRILLLERILKVVEEDNERLLRQLRERIDRVGLELPKIEVRYDDLFVEADAYVGSRALPTLVNATINSLEGIIGFFRLSPTKKRLNRILRGVSGILKPARMTLLLGPPSSGKTTFLLSLSGKLDKNLRVSGKVEYCGHELSEFVVQRTCAYISQYDLHIGEMTVRETLDFSQRCLGMGSKYDMLTELSRREKDADIKPDYEVDAFMKATAMEGQNTNLVTDYIIKVLGLDICADIMVGNAMRRGISGGQKKRLTTGEMLVGPARAFFMDEISNGLDSSTTFQIIKFIRQMVHIMDVTVIVSLLQPAPETFELFDDIILLSEGQILYHGPREKALEFFESLGFKCPERKGVADFLQEVISKKDQQQYWFSEDKHYHYVSVSEFAHFFRSSYLGRQIAEDLASPYDKSKTHPSALTTKKYGMSSLKLLKACFSREWLLMRRNSFLYIFKILQITIMSMIAMTVFLRVHMHHETISDGGKYFSALFFCLVNMIFNGMAEMSMTVQRLPVFYKQRDFLFYPPWAFGLSYSLLKIPLSLLESGIMACLTYYVIGFAPAASRFFRLLVALFFVHQSSLSIFRLSAAVGRTMIITNTFGFLSLIVVYALGGFLISRDSIQPWWIWAYWISPFMYGMNAISVNEFLDSRWEIPNNDASINERSIGKAFLKTRGLFGSAYCYWISIGALIGLSLILNCFFILALTYLNPRRSSQAILVIDEDVESETISSEKATTKSKILKGKPESSMHNSSAADLSAISDGNINTTFVASVHQEVRGMILTFKPLSFTFSHVSYYVDMPAEMKKQGVEQTRLQLLSDVSGAFRPGVLTALVGISGAGKTTLLDVLAGRKNGGYTEGNIKISGYAKQQGTFARVSGYCEQNDIHSPHVTIYESLVFSAWLRLASDITEKVRTMFIEEIMELVELNMLRDALVGIPGVDGLSIEQRKRLTIAVELVANPSIIFMDEPTTGLDARAAAIVMRTVRNIVDTGRTVVCTIHQPSIDIFETFDELLLMKRGGKIIYAGPLGHHSSNLVQYFEAIPGVQKIKEGVNPATWMLDISSSTVESKHNLDFAELYYHSPLYQKNQDLIKELAVPTLGSTDLVFPTKYAQGFTNQFMACLWKQNMSYWKNPSYSAIRFFVTTAFGVILGTIFWKRFKHIKHDQDLLNLLGAVYTAVFVMGVNNFVTCQPIVAMERIVFYREKAAGMYADLSYAFAQVMVEVIYILPQSLVYVLILYPLIGFDWKASNFFWCFYFVFMSLLYFAMCGMMMVSLTPNYQVAAIVSTFIFPLWNLFSGIVIYRPQLPIWWRWFYWCDPVAWTLHGMIQSQLGDNNNMLQIAGQASMPVNAYIREKFGYKGDLGYVALAHLMFVFIFFFVFSYSIKFLNFQKR